MKQSTIDGTKRKAVFRLKFMETYTCLKKQETPPINNRNLPLKKYKKHTGEDGGNIGGSGIHFPSTPGKYLADPVSYTHLRAHET